MDKTSQSRTLLRLISIVELKIFNQLTASSTCGMMMVDHRPDNLQVIISELRQSTIPVVVKAVNGTHKRKGIWSSCAQEASQGMRIQI